MSRAYIQVLKEMGILRVIEPMAKIPEPFFRASPYCFTIEHGLAPRSGARQADPARGERPLGNFILPPFQRPSVWTVDQAIRFVESVWMDLPIASYVVNRDDCLRDDWPCDQWLLDGQQRWTALIDYTQSKFAVYGSLFNDLDLRYRRRFENKVFPCIMTRDLTPEKCKEVYERLAYGGTNHEPKT